MPFFSAPLRRLLAWFCPLRVRLDLQRREHLFSTLAARRGSAFSARLAGFSVTAPLRSSSRLSAAGGPRPAPGAAVGRVVGPGADRPLAGASTRRSQSPPQQHRPQHVPELGCASGALGDRGGVPGEAECGRANQVTRKSPNSFSPNVLQSYPPNDPGEVHKCQRVAEMLPKGCRTVAPGAKIRPNISPHLAVSVKFWSTWPTLTTSRWPTSTQAC